MNPGRRCHADMQFDEQAHSAESQTEDLGTKRMYGYFALFPPQCVVRVATQGVDLRKMLDAGGAFSRPYRPAASDTQRHVRNGVRHCFQRFESRFSKLSAQPVWGKTIPSIPITRLALAQYCLQARGCRSCR